MNRRNFLRISSAAGAVAAVPVTPTKLLDFLKLGISPAEAAKYVVPVNYAFPPGNPRRQGAPIDGVTSAVTAFLTQDSTGEQVYVTRGTYLIDSSVTLNSNYKFESGAMITYPTNGVTIIFTGDVDAGNYQIFKPKGRGTSIVQAGTAPNQSLNVPWHETCPEWWGARGMSGPNALTTGDTAAVQACLSFGPRKFKFCQSYPVTQVTLGISATGTALSEIAGDFAGYRLYGIASTATPSVLDIIAGYETVYNIKVDAQMNTNYQVGVHLYTYNLNIFQPEFNQLIRVDVYNALIGHAIGGLPTQAIPLPAQGSGPGGTQPIVTPPNATDAPVSECTIYGLKTHNCVIGAWVTQPNGKIKLVSCELMGSHAQWTSFGSSGYTVASTQALVIRNYATQASEIAMIGGSLIQNTEPTGYFFSVINGHFTAVGTSFETVAPAYLAGAVDVSLTQIMNAGWNYENPYVAFLVDQNASGQLNISDGFLSLPPGYLTAGTLPFAKSTSDRLGTFAPNYGHFRVNFLLEQLRDVPFIGTNVYVPLCQGLDYTATNCTLSSYQVVGGVATRIALYKLHDLPANKLDGVVDVSSYSVTPYGANGHENSGGWAFSGRGQWGSEPSGLAVEGFILDTCLHLSSPVSGSQTATSTNTFNVEPEAVYQVRGWINTPTTSGGRVFIGTNNFQYGGSASGKPVTYFINVPDAQLGVWQQLQGFIKIPKDTTKVSFFVSCQNGAAVRVAGLEQK